MVYSAKSDDTDIISQFTRRKAIKITTGGTNTPSDYQVKLAITFEPGMQADFEDIRFNTRAGAYIDYWIESYVSSTSAVVWVELPDAIAHPGSDTIWMYYGNAGLSDGGNIIDTFIVGDDGESGEPSDDWIQESTATIVIESSIIKSGSYSLKIDTGATLQSSMYLSLPNLDCTILEYSMRVPTTIASIGGVLHDGIYTNEKGTAFFYRNGTDTFQYYDTAYHVVQTASTDTWYDIKLVAKSVSAYDIYIDDVLKTTDAVMRNSPAKFDRAAFGGYHSNGIVYIDNVRVRKYIANEPTVSHGTAQHQRKVPQFM